MEKYIKPEMIVNTAELHDLVATSPLVEVTNDQADPNQENLAGRRRDSWGDLWGD